MHAKRKLMILGAGMCQVPIIQKAQRMRFETIAVSIPGPYPGFRVSDRYYEVDVRDRQRILEIAQDERICGILTDQTDIPVPTVAYVAERMGLPGIGYECALRFTHKGEMRRFCERVGIPVPKHGRATSRREAYEIAETFGFPVVIKPMDSQGSRGVSLVESFREIEVKFPEALRYSGCGEVIIEEFFPGKEIVVEGFVSEFAVTNLVIGDREYFDLPNLFIPKTTLFPCNLEDRLREKILGVNTRLLQEFGLPFGITHSEYLVDEETGELRLVEVAARGGGVFISSDLIPAACGIDVNELLIWTVTGERSIHIPAGGLLGAASGYVCFTLPRGVIRAVRNLEAVAAMPGVLRTYLDGLRIGAAVREMRDKTDRLGPILMADKDRSSLCEALKAVKETLAVEVETAEGLGGVQW